MATFGAIIGLRVPGVEVINIETTGKTLPQFPQMWADLIAGKKKVRAARQDIPLSNSIGYGKDGDRL